MGSPYVHLSQYPNFGSQNLLEDKTEALNSIQALVVHNFSASEELDNENNGFLEVVNATVVRRIRKMDNKAKSRSRNVNFVP